MEAPARASNSIGVIMIWWLIILMMVYHFSCIYRDLFNSTLPQLIVGWKPIDIHQKRGSSIDFMMVAHAASWTALNRSSNVQPQVPKRSAFVFCCIDLVYCDLAVLSWLAAHCGYSCFKNLSLYYSSTSWRTMNLKHRISQNYGISEPVWWSCDLISLFSHPKVSM